jgi:hypothetical protein
VRQLPVRLPNESKSLSRFYGFDGNIAHSEYFERRNTLCHLAELVIASENAYAYNNRAVLRYDLGDKQGGIADMQQAANLFLQQSDMQGYKYTTNQLKKMR